jgi:hypothetical protein
VSIQSAPQSSPKARLITAADCSTDPTGILPPVKSSAHTHSAVFLLLPASAFAANSVMNMSHCDLMPRARNEQLELTAA